MRQFIALGLCFCFAASAAAQTEVIIRRPGERDQVIRLDSAQTREALKKTQLELRKATTSMQAHLQEMESQLGRVRLTELPARINTLALRNSALASRNTIEPLIMQLQESRRQPHLGVTVDVRPRDTDKWGAYVSSVTPGSPADRAGILSGDIITRIAGKSLTEKRSKDDEDSNPGLRLMSIVSELEAGKAVEVDLRRGNQNRTVRVTPSEDDSPTIARVMPDRTPMAGGLGYSMPDHEWSGRLSIAEPAMPSFESPSMSLFSSGAPGSYFYSFGSGGLFANLELTSVNEKLGAYFGTSEGVLVVNTMTEWPTFIRSFRNDSGRGAGRGAARSGRLTADSMVQMIDGRPVARAGGGAGRFSADTFDVRGNAVRANTLGLEPGDVIVSVDGRKVTTPSQLMRIVGTYDRGEEFKLQIMRQKHAESLTVKMP